MPHILADMEEDITRLEGDNSNPAIATKLADLRAKVSAVDEFVNTSEDPTTAEAHEVLQDCGKWLKKAEVTDNDFEDQLDSFISQLDQYD